MLIGLVGHLLSAPLNGANPSPDEFFGRNPAALAGVAAPGVYPYGSKFPFGAYSAQGQNQAIPESSNLQRIAQQGFTLAGPYYHDDWQDFRYVREAAGEGLQVTYQVRPHPALVGVSVDDRPGVIESLSDDQIRASVRQQVQAALADAVAGPAIARWSLQPEELRYWYDQELRYLRLTREAIRQAESAVGAAKRPFLM